MLCEPNMEKGEIMMQREKRVAKCEKMMTGTIPVIFI